MINPHHTGHARTPDGHLVRVDFEHGRWVASLFDGLTFRQQYVGTDEQVHTRAAYWLGLHTR